MAGLFESDLVLKQGAYMNKLFNIQVLAAPMLKLLPRGENPGDMLTHWGVENYPVTAVSGTIDGTDKTTYSSNVPTEMEAYAQCVTSDGWQVGNLANLTNTAPIPAARQKANQIAKDALAHTLALNRLILSTQEMAVESKPSQAFQLRGMLQWMSTSAQAVKPVNASFRPASDCVYTSTLAGYDKADLETQLEAAFTAKRAPVDLMHFVGVKLKKTMTVFTEKRAVSSDETMSMFNQDAASKRLISAVDIFDFDAGTVRNILTPDIACDLSTGLATAYSTRSGIGIDTSMWELCFLEPTTPYENPDLGGGPRGFHRTTLILKCLNPLGQIMEYIGS